MKKTVVEEHFDQIATDYDYYKKKNIFYYSNLKKLLTTLIPKNKKVLEIGCGTGDLLFKLKPKFGYGMDLSAEMIKIASMKYKKEKNIKFSTNWPEERFDYIFMSDVIEHLENPSEVFKKISLLMGKDTIFINTMANPVWEPVLMIGEKIGFKMPEGKHIRISFKKIEKIMGKFKLKIVSHDYKLLIPVNIPIITSFANKYIERFLKQYAFIEYFVVKKD